MRPRQDAPGLFARRWEPSHRLFHDRRDAGVQLAAALLRYRDRSALVLGVPRGGVPVAAEIAQRLDAELDVIVARKIGAPRQEELALGAITADGTTFLNHEIIASLGVDDVELAVRARVQQTEALRREERWRKGQPPLVTRDRTVLLVDDGLATGATMRAAIRSLRLRRVGRLVVAVPVAAAESAAVIAREVDELVCLHRPEPFLSVGLHYEQFDPTSDEAVDEILARYRRRHPSPPKSAS